MSFSRDVCFKRHLKSLLDSYKGVWVAGTWSPLYYEIVFCILYVSNSSKMWSMLFCEHRPDIMLCLETYSNCIVFFKRFKADFCLVWHHVMFRNLHCILQHVLYEQNLTQVSMWKYAQTVCLLKSLAVGNGYCFENWLLLKQWVRKEFQKATTDLTNPTANSTNEHYSSRVTSI